MENQHHITEHRAGGQPFQCPVPVYNVNSFTADTHPIGPIGFTMQKFNYTNI